jgi:hypothetical protein
VKYANSEIDEFEHLHLGGGADWGDISSQIDLAEAQARFSRLRALGGR